MPIEKDPDDSMYAGYSVPFGDDPDDSFYSGYSIPTQAVGRPKKTKHSYLEIGEGATPGDAVESQTDDVYSVTPEADIVTSGLTATDGESKATDMAKNTLPASGFERMRSVYNGFAEADASGEIQGAQTSGVRRHSAAAADYQGYGESTAGGMDSLQPVDLPDTSHTSSLLRSSLLRSSSLSQFSLCSFLTKVPINIIIMKCLVKII